MWPWLALTAAGLLQAFAIAWPWHGTASIGLVYGAPQPYSQWLGIALLVKVIHAASGPIQAMRWSWWAFTVSGAATFWWLYVSMAHFGGVPPWLAVLAVGALAGALAIYGAVTCGWVFARLNKAPRGLLPVVFAATWMLAEWARGTWWSGFPWGNAATAHVTGLGVLAPWLGALGVGALAAGLSAWLGMVPWTGPGRWRLILALVVGAVALSPRAPWDDADWSLTRSGNSSSVTLLQGNIDQAEKFDPEVGIPKALAWYGEELLKPTADLVVAPETAIPLLQTQLEPGYWQALWTGLSQGEHAAMLGVPVENVEGGYENAAWLVTPEQAQAMVQASFVTTLGAPLWPESYSKIHLVPFGEYTPAGFRWFAGVLGMPLNGFTAGRMDQPSRAWAGQRWGVQICYEDVFGAELAMRMQHSAPTVWVNLSNIAWFGNTVAIPQHLNIARWRARELGRPTVRATNTGATAVIDHLGRVQAALPPNTRGVLTAEVTGREGLTPYAQWAGRWGDLPLVAWALGCLVFAAWRQRTLVHRSERPLHKS